MTQVFSGTVSEATIWSTALTDEDVAYLATLDPTKTIHWWRRVWWWLQSL